MIQRIIGRAGRVLLGAVTFVSTAFGFFFEDQIVKITSSPLAVYIAAPGLVALLTAGLYFLFKNFKHYHTYLNAVDRGWTWIWSIPVGGIGRAYLDLFRSLWPFLPNPGVIVVLTLYFLLLIDLWWIKKVFQRALKLARSHGPPKRLPNLRF